MNLALDHIESEGYWRYIIFTDSLSTIQALQKDKIENPIIVNLLSKLSRICATSLVVFCWIPSHMGFHGNETVGRDENLLFYKRCCLLKYLILILNL